MAWKTPDWLWEPPLTDRLVGDPWSEEWPDTFTLRAPDHRATVAHAEARPVLGQPGRHSAENTDAAAGGEPSSASLAAASTPSRANPAPCPARDS